MLLFRIDAEKMVQNANRCETPRQLEAVFRLLMIDDSTAVNPDNAEKVLALLYRILDTFDSKTSFLLSCNAILVAAQVFLAGTVVSDSSLSVDARVALFLSVLLPLAGAWCALGIFKVKWPFLAGLTQVRDCEESPVLHEFIQLAKVCDKRYDAHQWVWFLTMASLVALVISVFGVLSWILSK